VPHSAKAMSVMRTTAFLMCLFVVSFAAAGQNLITNPGFETGPLPTGLGQITSATDWTSTCAPFAAHLFDSRVSASIPPPCDVSALSNIWGSRAPHGGFRYVGIGGDQQNNHGSSATGLVLCPPGLGAGNYVVKFWASAIDWIRTPNSNSCGPGVPWSPSSSNIVEVVLRKSTDCTVWKLVSSSLVMPKSWAQYSGTFTLTAGDALKYNRIEFRMKQASTWPEWYRFAYLDDVVLLPNPMPAPLSAQFGLVASVVGGSTTTFTCTATPVVALTSCLAACWWYVCECGPISPWICIPNGVWGSCFFPSFPQWCASCTSTTPTPLTFPGFAFLLGHTYRITYSVRNLFYPVWVSSSKVVLMAAPLKAGGVPAFTIINDDSYKPPSLPSEMTPAGS